MRALRVIWARTRTQEFWPVFQLDNINEQLSLDFVIDGHAQSNAPPRRHLEVSKYAHRKM